MAEIAGVDPRSIKAWSLRSTRLREWARNNLAVINGEPTAAQLSAAQKATRPAKPESLSWAALKAHWRAPWGRCCRNRLRFNSLWTSCVC